MGSFLEPGEEYEIPFTKGKLICKALSFREQRKAMKLLKELQTNNDPDRSMEIIEEIITIGTSGWDLAEPFSIEALLGKIVFQESMDIGKRIIEGGKLSSEERKK